jgi:hypothetical protein
VALKESQQRNFLTQVQGDMKSRRKKSRKEGLWDLGWEELGLEI